MDSKMLTVGLLWHSVNSNNLGVGALTLANAAIIERVAARLGMEVEFLVMGWGDDREPYMSSANLTMIPLRPREHFLRPHRLAAIIRRCDVVFDIGYGDSFSDLYGIRRFLWFFVTKAMVHLCRRPLVLSPQTIGPFRRRWVRLLAKAVMRRASAVLARDRLSCEYMRAMGVHGGLEAVDVAFGLPAAPPPLQPSEKIRVGINISGLLYNEGKGARRCFGLEDDYAAVMGKIIGYFESQANCEVHLIGHVFSDDPKEDDRRAIHQVAEECPNLIVAPEFTSPEAAKGYISAMDFFIGARMHACIAAFSSGVPVIPMAYSRKFAGLFGSLGYDYVADCTRDGAQAVLATVRDGFEKRAELGERILRGMDGVHKKLVVYESVITRIILSSSNKLPDKSQKVYSPNIRHYRAGQSTPANR